MGQLSRTQIARHSHTTGYKLRRKHTTPSPETLFQRDRGKVHAEKMEKPSETEQRSFPASHVLSSKKKIDVEEPMKDEVVRRDGGISRNNSVPS